MKKYKFFILGPTYRGQVNKQSDSNILKGLIFLLYSLCFVSVTLVANGIGSSDFKPFKDVTFLYQIQDRDIVELKEYLDRSLEKIKNQEDPSDIIKTAVIQIIYVLNRTNIGFPENQTQLNEFIEIVFRYIEKLSLQEIEKFHLSLAVELPNDFKYSSSNSLQEFLMFLIKPTPKNYKIIWIKDYILQIIHFIQVQNQSLKVEGFLASHPIDLPEYLIHATFNDIHNIIDLLKKESNSKVIDEIHRLLINTDIIFSDELFQFLEEAIYASRDYYYRSRGYKAFFRKSFLDSEVFWEEFAQKTHPFSQYVKVQDYHWLYGKLSSNTSSFFDFLTEYRNYLRNSYKDLEIKDDLKQPSHDIYPLSRLNIFEVTALLRDINKFSIKDNEPFYHIPEVHLKQLSKLLLETDITLKENKYLLQIIIKVMEDSERDSLYKVERSINKFYSFLAICHPYIDLEVIKAQYPRVTFSKFFSLCADVIGYIYKDIKYLDPILDLNQYPKNQDILNLSLEDIFKLRMDINDIKYNRDISHSVRLLAQRIVYFLGETDFLLSSQSVDFVNLLDETIKELYRETRVELLLSIIEEVAIKLNQFNTSIIVERPSFMSERFIYLRNINNLFKEILKYRVLNTSH